MTTSLTKSTNTSALRSHRAMCGLCQSVHCTVLVPCMVLIVPSAVLVGTALSMRLKSSNGRDITKRAIGDVNSIVSGIITLLLTSRPFKDLISTAWGRWALHGAGGHCMGQVSTYDMRLEYEGGRSL